MTASQRGPWRMIDEQGRQIVRVRLNAGRTYAYTWEGRHRLAVGDRVYVPTGGPYEVVGHGTNYPGDLAAITGHGDE